MMTPVVHEVTVSAMLASLGSKGLREILSARERTFSAQGGDYGNALQAALQGAINRPVNSRQGTYLLATLIYNHAALGWNLEHGLIQGYYAWESKLLKKSSTRRLERVALIYRRPFRS